MKKSLIKKAACMVAAAALAVTTMIVPAFAEATPLVMPNPTYIEISRTVENVKSAVSNTFTYKIEYDATSSTNGVAAPTFGSVEEQDMVISKAPSSTENFVTETLNFDISGLTFTEVGDYGFIISETESSNEAMYPIDETKYLQIISVRWDTSHTILVADVSDLVYKADSPESGKTELNFSQPIANTNLSLSKQIEGNMADADEYFKFELNIDGTPGVIYTISGLEPTVMYDNAPINNPTQYTVGTPAQYVYLKDGQTAIIGVGNMGENQIPVGTVWSVVEQDATEYDTKVTGTVTADGKESGNATANVEPAQNKMLFDNSRDLAVDTGAFATTAPIVALGLVLVAGVTAIFVLNKKMKKTKEN